MAAHSALIHAIAQLPLLETLSISREGPICPDDVSMSANDLRPLAVLPRLTALTVGFPVDPSLAVGLQLFPTLEYLALPEWGEEQLANSVRD